MSIRYLADDVILVPIFSEFDVVGQRIGFVDACHNFPEFKNGPYVLGAFGALGNPASFHCPWVRNIRDYAYHYAVAALRNRMEPGERFHMLFDRMCIRRAGTAYQGEGWHRDVCEKLNSLPSDKIWGGWINLDLQDQVFTCVPDSSDDPHVGAGFAKADTPPDHMVRQIKVPSGYMVLFRQDILHTITKSRFFENSYRVFVGFRITTSDQPLYDVMDIVTNQKVPPLPSGQMPSMFSANHDSCLLYKQTIPWSDAAVHDIWKQERTIRGGTVVRVVPRFIRRGLLEVLGMTYEKYSEEEIKQLLPHFI